ncbi:MAG: hypothetical protein AB1641_22105 [Thermodesulfobacteriota bacterium]
MDLDYSPFHPLVWFIFGLFCLGTYLAVRLFHRRYPHYPRGKEDDAPER